MKTRHLLLASLVLAGCKIHVLGSTEEPTTEETSVPGGATAADFGIDTPSVLQTAGIPVLAFHEICASTCTAADSYGVSPEEFERILTVLDTHGYETISMTDFARAHRGDTKVLPRRSILITFDDGRQDAYVGADPVLAKHGMQATMFVITNGPSSKPNWYMSWPEIQDAAASGRWNMQVHAHAGHVQIPIAMDAKGAPVVGDFYANLGCADAPCGALETHDAWHTRAVSDLEMADAVLAAKLGDLYTSHSFAVPFSDYGQDKTNDPVIPEDLRAYFDAHYEAWFTQGADAAFMTPSPKTHEVKRFELTNKLTSVDVDAWLTKHETP